jgi:hypothetical protein
MSHFHDVTAHFWNDLVSRPAGPLAFRFILQPLMAAALAIRDGYKDAKSGRPPYLHTMVYDKTQRGRLALEGFHAVLRVMIFAAVMDVIYQLVELDGIHVLQTVFIVIVLAILPYLILRGPADRLMRWWLARESSGHGRIQHG